MQAILNKFSGSFQDSQKDTNIIVNILTALYNNIGGQDEWFLRWLMTNTALSLFFFLFFKMKIVYYVTKPYIVL